MTGDDVGQVRLKALTAWFTSATRSARNSTRLTQLQRISRSHSAITVRVLPAPVAMTSSALRSWSRSKASRDAADGARLVVALDDRRVDRRVGQRLAACVRRWISSSSSAFL